MGNSHDTDNRPEPYPLTATGSRVPPWVRITAWAVGAALLALGIGYLAAPADVTPVCDFVTGEQAATLAARHGGAYSDGHWIVDGIDLGAAYGYDSGFVACAPEGTPVADEIVRR